MFACPVLNFVKKYRGHLDIKCHTFNDSTIPIMAVNMHNAEASPNPNKWKQELDNEEVDNFEYDAEMENENIRILTDDHSRPIVPSQIITYDNNLTELTNDGFKYTADSDYLESLYNGYISELRFTSYYEYMVNHPVNEEESNYDTDSLGSELEDELEDPFDYEEEPLPVHHHGFCNICFEDNKGLVHMPDCNCIGVTDFTFLCSDCQPKLLKCPNCRSDY